MAGRIDFHSEIMISLIGIADWISDITNCNCWY